MITRFASGLPVTFASSGDNYLVQVQNNGVNATSIDMPDYDGSGYKLNHNPRNGKPCFNTAAFSPNALGTQGNSKRRMFYGPGIDNYDMALHRVTELSEGCSLEFRVEMFNVFILRLLRGIYAFAIWDQRRLGALPCPRSLWHQAPLHSGNFRSNLVCLAGKNSAQDSRSGPFR